MGADCFEDGYRAGIMAALCQFASDQDVDLSLERLLSKESWLAANIRASGTGALQQALAKLESADRKVA